MLNMPDSRVPIIAALALHGDTRRALGLDLSRMAFEGGEV